METDNSSVILILQARMGSTRLPGKSMATLGNSTLVEIIMRKLNSLKVEKWIATTTNPEDDVFVELALKFGWRIYRGSSENVLSRFENILNKSDATYCVRVTADNPLISQLGIQKMIDLFCKNQFDADYMSDFDFNFYPLGAFGEIFRVKVFKESLSEIPESETWHFSHVTTWLRKNCQIRGSKMIF